MFCTCVVVKCDLFSLEGVKLKVESLQSEMRMSVKLQSKLAAADQTKYTVVLVSLCTFDHTFSSSPKTGS